MVFKGKNGSKNEFHKNGVLATLGSNFQEGQI
jgi:esterase/lipase superfamily enzyme